MGVTGWIGRWWRSVIFAAGGVAAALVMAGDGHLLVGSIVGVIMIGAAVFFSPRRAGRSLGHAEAQRRAREEGLLVAYWRPGCAKCEQLRAELRGERGVLWVDIWQDPEAAAFVRELNNGVELVPTVIAGRAVWPVPGAQKVRSALRAAYAG